MTKQYRSPVMASIHETAEGLHAAGVMVTQTMRRFDDACLTPVRPLTPEEIRALREREGASSAISSRTTRPGCQHKIYPNRFCDKGSRWRACSR